MSRVFSSAETRFFKYNYMKQDLMQLPTKHSRYYINVNKKMTYISMYPWLPSLFNKILFLYTLLLNKNFHTPYKRNNMKSIKQGRERNQGTAVSDTCMTHIHTLRTQPKEKNSIAKRLKALIPLGNALHTQHTLHKTQQMAPVQAPKPHKIGKAIVRGCTRN